MRLPVIPWLVLSDSIILALLTAAGFATHGTLQAAGARLLATFFPLLVVWLLLAALLGEFQPGVLDRPHHLWRVALAAALASLAAAVGRAAWMGGVIIPTFVLVLVATNTLAMLLWRSLLVFLSRQRWVTWMSLR